MSELGLRLKSAREEKGYSHEELQSLTKIQKRYLIAIENGDFSKMPGDFYARAFVKSYCEAVGLESDMVFEEHKDELPQPKREPSDLPPRINRSPNTKKKSKIAALVPTVIAVLFITVIVALIWFSRLDNDEGTPGITRQDQFNGPNVDISNVEGNENNETNANNQDNNNEENNNEEANDENNENEEDESESEPVFTLEESDGDTSVFSLSETDTFDVTMEFSGQSWISIFNSSGDDVYGQMHASEDEATFDFSDEEQIRIRVGSTPTTDIFINDELVEYPLELTTQNIIIQYSE
ncbi:RodZ domain-containing protein [Salipaludibacillus sp. HK11]|uniref:helix-turn-helix domain-containing protein n=1 Tax=Salipaludibacillus sp. HK11 TaxID=3394320 RepID=UPI0039FD903A